LRDKGTKGLFALLPPPEIGASYAVERSLVQSSIAGQCRPNAAA
jgi:hypothetical protein